MQIADTRGLDAVSMRRVADELGVEAMSLYHHVAKKEDILNGIADMVVAEMEPASGADWKAALRTTAISAHHVLLRHRWAARLLLSGTISQARLRYMDAMLGTLRRAGFSADMTDHAYHALDSHIMGFTLWLVGMNLPSDEEFSALAAEFLAQLPRDEMPHLAEHVEQHLRPRSDDDKDEFEFGLDLILDGLERMLRGAAS
jgi:AcrR family transcriptional regulator